MFSLRRIVVSVAMILALPAVLIAQENRPRAIVKPEVIAESQTDQLIRRYVCYLRHNVDTDYYTLGLSEGPGCTGGAIVGYSIMENDFPEFVLEGLTRAAFEHSVVLVGVRSGRVFNVALYATENPRE